MEFPEKFKINFLGNLDRKKYLAGVCLFSHALADETVGRSDFGNSTWQPVLLIIIFSESLALKISI